MMTANSRNNLALIGLLAVMAVLFAWPVFVNPDFWGIQDWDWFLLFDGVTRESFLKYRQFPLWNPYWKGGMPLLAHPESNTLSPALLVQLLFEVVWAAKINIALHLFLGLVGTYLLAGHFRLERPAAILAAGLYMLNSMFALALTVGMEWGNQLAFIPWVLWFYLKAQDDFRYAFAAALGLTMMWLGGGVYPFTISLLLLGTYSLAAICCRELVWRKTIGILITVFLLTFLLGAYKFFPALEFTHQYQRHSELYAGLSLESLSYGLFGRDQTLAAIHGRTTLPGFWQGFSQGMDEVGMYVGLVPFALFLVGLWSQFRRYRVLIICLLVFLWLAFGSRSEPFSLWSLLRTVPPYSVMRSVERFRFVVVLALAILAGAGLQVMTRRLAEILGPGRWLSGLGPLIVTVIFLDLFLVNSPVFKDAFTIPPIPTPSNESFLQIGGFPEYDRNGPVTADSDPLYSSYGASYPALLANAGSVFAYVSVPVPENAVIMSSPLYRGEVYLEGTEGTARYRDWSFNRLEVELQAAGDGYLLINQNYYPGWRAEGLKVEPVRGLLGVRIEPGIHRVVLYYCPTSFVLGATISALSLLLMGGWFWQLQRRRSRLAGGTTR